MLRWFCVRAALLKYWKTGKNLFILAVAEYKSLTLENLINAVKKIEMLGCSYDHTYSSCGDAFDLKQFQSKLLKSNPAISASY